MAGYDRLRPPQVQQAASVTLNLVRFVVGFAVYTIAIGRVLDNRKLRRHFDRTMAGLDRLIATLEAKQASHQSPAAV
jgi:hypothetical protein